jgi:ankyrin repeat protein
LYDAAWANDSALVLKLLKQGAELEWRNSDCNGDTALAVACYVGSYEAAEALCAHGAELDTRTDSQSTPLIFAACRGSTKICEMLLALGADPSLKHESGKTALNLARACNKPECVALLQPVTPGA